MTTFPIVEETEEQPQIETRNAQCEAQRVAYTRPRPVNWNIAVCT